MCSTPEKMIETYRTYVEENDGRIVDLAAGERIRYHQEGIYTVNAWMECVKVEKCNAPSNIQSLPPPL